MKEYICVDDTYKSLDEDERKVFLKLVGKSMRYTKADIRREFAKRIKEELKEQDVKGIIYASNEDEIDTMFNIPKMIDNVLAEMESE